MELEQARDDVMLEVFKMQAGSEYDLNVRAHWRVGVSRPTFGRSDAEGLLLRHRQGGAGDGEAAGLRVLAHAGGDARRRPRAAAARRRPAHRRAGGEVLCAALSPMTSCLTPSSGWTRSTRSGTETPASRPWAGQGSGAPSASPPSSKWSASGESPTGPDCGLFRPDGHVCRIEKHQIEDKQANKQWLARFLELCRMCIPQDLKIIKVSPPHSPSLSVSFGPCRVVASAAFHQSTTSTRGSSISTTRRWQRR